MTEEKQRISLPQQFSHFFEIVYVKIKKDFTVPKGTIGIIFDTAVLNKEKCELLISNQSIDSSIGVCIIDFECNFELLQYLSTFFRTLCFKEDQFLNDASQNFAYLVNFFISIVNTKRENRSVHSSQERSDVIETLRVVAHQWRQPLNLISVEAINLVVQASLDEQVSAKEIIKSANSISEQTQRMSNVLKSLLDLGRIQRRKEIFFIHDLLKSVEEFFSEQLKQKKILLHVEYPRDGSQIDGFIHDLREVLVNIISNARDAYLEHQQAEENEIFLHVSESKKSYIFSIKDEAGGIPLLIQKKIFEPNFSTKGSGEGFGIGLHVAKLIIEQEFFGTLTLQSDERGSLFTIKIPKTDLSNLKFIR